MTGATADRDRGRPPAKAKLDLDLDACRGFTMVPAGALVLRAGAGGAGGGGPITAARRDELLAKVAAGAYVELELDLVAYEQKTGERNRNSVRFRDGGMLAFGRSGKGNPFLRDHNQGEQAARGGTVIASSAEKIADGHYQIRQTVRVTAPWAVDAALRGLIGGVSIGWHPTGPVLCSVCGADYFGVDCTHYRGRETVNDDGKTVVCELVFHDAELIESSVVNVPAVPSARVDEVRAAALARAEAALPYRSPAAATPIATHAKTMSELLASAEAAGVINGPESDFALILSTLPLAEAARIVGRRPTQLQMAEIVINMKGGTLPGVRSVLASLGYAADAIDPLIAKHLAEPPRPVHTLTIEAEARRRGIDVGELRRVLRAMVHKDVDGVIERQLPKVLAWLAGAGARGPR